MISKNDWYMSIENPQSNQKYIVYYDGLIYDPNQKKQLFILKEDAITSIKDIIKPNLTLLRQERFINDGKGKFIIRINARSRKHTDCIKVINRFYETNIISIILNKENIKEMR